MVQKKGALIAEERARRAVMGGARAAAGRSVASRFGLRDEASEALLARALEARPTAQPAAIEARLHSFNVLTRALYDVETGELLLQGYTDPRYATGPLPHEAWLVDALANPAPIATLVADTTRTVPPRLDADLQRLAQDPGFALSWLKRLFNPVIFRQAELGAAERAQLDQRLQTRLGIKPAQHEAYAAWHRAGRAGFADVQQYYDAREFMARLLHGVGCPLSTGRTLMAVKRASADPTPATGSDVYAQAGAAVEFDEISRRYRAKEITNPQAGALLVAAYGGPVLRGLGCPEAQVQALVGGVRAGGPEDALLAEMNRRWEEKTQEALIRHVLHGFRFSSATLGTLYDLPIVRSPIDLRGGRRDSALLRALFEADAALKHLVTGGKADVDSFDVTLLAQPTSGKLPRTGMNRYAIEPGAVVLQELPRAQGVSFASARLAFRASVLSADGADEVGIASYRRALEAYTQILDAAQERAAQQVPAIHAVREAAKIVALARWLRSKGIQPRLRPASAAVPLPESFEGFWSLLYLREPRGDSDTLMVSASGGVSFGPELGDGWWQAAPAATADNDTLRQLAASTALAEQAATAAIGGDLEGARALAESSVQAMTGQLDLQRLAQVEVPHPAGDAAALSGVVQAQIPAAAVVVVERELANLKSAGAPPAAEAVEASRAKLQRLQTLLRNYRENPQQGRAVRVDLSALAWPERAVVAPVAAAPAPPVAGPAAPPPRPAAPVSAPLAEAVTPTRAEPKAAPQTDDESLVAGCRAAQQEAAALRSELDRLQTALRRLNRSIQSDQAQLAEWGALAQRSIDEVKSRSWRLLWDVAVFHGTAIAGRHCGTTGARQADCNRQVDALKKLHEVTKLSEWGGKKDTSWSYVGEGMKELLSLFVKEGPLSRTLSLIESVAASSFDVLAWIKSYQALGQLEANAESFLLAVEGSSARMRVIVERLRAIEGPERCPTQR